MKYTLFEFLPTFKGKPIGLIFKGQVFQEEDGTDRLSQNVGKKLDVRGSVHHSTVRKEKFQQDVTMYQHFFIIPYLYEARHVSGDTPSIIRSLKLHWQPLVIHTCKVVGSVVGGRCQAQCA